MKKVLLVATVVKTHIMQFHLPLIQMLKDMSCQVDVAAKNDYEDKADCSIPGCDNYYDIEFARNPIKSDNIRAYRQLKCVIDEGGYDIIHCNTPVAGILTRLAAKDARRNGTKVIYMAHGFHFFKGAPLKNWMLYYPAEKYCSKLTDVLITINVEDYALAKKKLHAVRTAYVPGVGIDTSRYESAEPMEDKSEGRRILLSVGELIDRKNHKAVIKALRDVPDDVDYWIAGGGEKKEELEELAGSLGLTDRVKLLGYRYDLPSIYKTADLFILPSFMEGLPVALMEAMASRVPAIASDVRGCHDLLEKDALFDPYDVDGIAEKINEFISGNHSEETERNFRRLSQCSLEAVLSGMKEIYLEIGRK